MGCRIWGLVTICVLSVNCENAGDRHPSQTERSEKGNFITEIIEEGRTLVQNNVRRFLILLPAIFFKLGVSFTMLVLVTIASATNGVIGFLVLVVGLSSVLARFQESRTQAAAVLPAYHQVPALAYHRNYEDWDRRDTSTKRSVLYGGYNKQYVYAPLNTYAQS